MPHLRCIDAIPKRSITTRGHVTFVIPSTEKQMMQQHKWTTWIWSASALAMIAAPIVVVSGISAANAQFWKFPWETDEPRRPPPRRSPPPGAPVVRDPQGRAPICLTLEQRLAEEANRGSTQRSRLPQINDNIRAARRNLRRAERDLDRRGCYEQFLFTRSLRRTRTCVQLDRSSREASRQIADLEARKQQILGSAGRSYQDDIIRELAHNNCGGIYQQEARRRNPFSNFWQDEDSGDHNYRGNTFAGLPFATYRTVCVRLCDGFYFPVSFSTLPTHFSRDANVCRSQCAAPAELYFHQNPGQSIDQMVSHASQQPYSDLKTAFRYRNEYVAGCSCKPTEYVPEMANASPQTQPNMPQTPTNSRPSAKPLSPVR